MEYEAAVGIAVDDEGAALKMAFAEPATYLKLFADNETAARACYEQSDNAARLAALKRFYGRYRPEIYSRPAPDKLRKLVGPITDGPAEEIRRLAVVGVEGGI